MRILALETSCDETAIAFVEAGGGLKAPRFRILKNLIASQIKIHSPFGGVVPNLAKREHIRNLPILFKKLHASGFKFHDVDLMAVTVGPGLEPCLWTGVEFAKKLHSEFRIKNSELRIIGANHLGGHLYSFLLKQKTMKHEAWSAKQVFPAISLIVSGGHTILILMKSLTNYKKLGETRDDAVGECFDKVARLLGLPYPGGPALEKLAQSGNPQAINFPRPMLNQKNYDFSFSGLKTAVFYYLRDNHSESISHKLKANTAASFQAAAFDVLIKKALRAVKEYKAKSILVSGGVASNNSLRNYLKLKMKNEKLKINLVIPEKKFCTDNAAMIAAAGYINFLRNKNRRLSARGNLSI